MTAARTRVIASNGNGTHTNVNSKIDQRVRPRDFFWGITLSKDASEHTWTLKDEDDDEDYLEHTLSLRQAVLGQECVDGQRNLVSVETQTYTGDKLKQPLFSLTSGKQDMCRLDINFGSDLPVTFRLLEGTGPVHLSALHTVEFPPEEMDDTQYTEYTASEEEEETSELAEPEPKGKKRKATDDKTGKKKKGKSSGTDAEEEEGEEEDESMGEEDEESESSPEKIAKKKPAVKSKVITKAAKKDNKVPAKKGKKK